ncbi:MAG: 50S ribosomal protein L17 [Thermoanaerobaculum sp.]
MRHNRAGRKLGRVSEHRRALFRNQLLSLIKHERIITTLPKAKELRPIAERMVTLGRKNSVHARRLVNRWVSDRDLIKKLFSEIAPRFATRPGGYTRIVKLGPRKGDGAELAILEFVDYKLPQAKKAKEAKEEKAKEKSAQVGR